MRERELLRSDKDLREHRAVVTAACAALSAVCERVDEPGEPVVLTLPTVHHLHTPLRARAREATHVLELVEALHPTPALGGLPGPAALAFLREYEGCERGWYAGPVGWFDARGEGAFVVAIRSALLRGDRAALFAGAGVVRGSRPSSELAEVRAKLSVMLRALGAGGDT